MRKARKYFLILCLVGFFLWVPDNSSCAQMTPGVTTTPPPCTITYTGVVSSEMANWLETLVDIFTHVAAEFFELQQWYVTTFFQNYWLPAFQQATAQLSAVSMYQTMIFGTFLDAKHQLETQQLLQRLSARAHKEYHPSTGLCEFGSGAKSLAASERRGEYNAIVMAQRSQDRALGSANTVAAASSNDMTARFEQFKKTFCDPQDNNGGLASVCQISSQAGQASKANKDIDYVRTVDLPWTLNVDFTDANVNGTDEQEVLALASNLYGHKVFDHAPVCKSQSAGSCNVEDEWKKKYMDMRSVIAQRNVAENSYNAIIGMKSAGTAGSKNYLSAILEDLGVNSTEAQQIMGENPSYYAQMEILTKKIYQNPDFYTNLYDTRANVSRKGVALQAINLMQKFDLLKSYLRNEASLSVLLEIALTQTQSELENK